MKAYRLLYPVSVMASVLKVSRSGFYKWLIREPSEREKKDNFLKTEIRRIHFWSRGTYGPVRIQAELKDAGIIVGRDRISRLRREMGLKCIQRKKFKATTNSKHNLPVAPNLLDQQFEIAEPGQVWGTDITYIGTDEGWLYLAGVKDFCSREIVGYAMNSRMTKELVRNAMKNALARRTPQAGCIHHSDRGSQYCSYDYQKDLKRAGFRVSMSRRGNCYDNAPTESLWGTIKQELIYQVKFKTRKDAQQAIREYIEVFYNRMRRHSKIGYMAPSIYTEKNHQERRSA
jgi:putative transposase